jgi:SAM-dependent methyltransferase
VQELYAARFSPEERAAKSRLWQALWSGFFRRYVPQDAAVLDLGAGSCELVNCVEARRRVALDMNPDLARHAAEGVEAHVLPLARLLEVVAPGSIDVAFASNVFEHLRCADELLEVLRAVRTALAAGGKLIVVQPNVRLTGGRFWDFFDHSLPLTEKGMAEVLTVAGFRVTEVRARFLPYTTKSRLPQSASLVRLYLKLRPAQWVFGKQMLVVALRD